MGGLKRPKFFRTFCCHSSNCVILGKTETLTVSDSFIGVVALTEAADSCCEGIGAPSLAGSMRAGDTWRVCAEAAADTAPGDVRRCCPAEACCASADAAVGLERP
eukprot:1676622-Pyramimonas_sp.AAC.1